MMSLSTARPRENLRCRNGHTLVLLRRRVFHSTFFVLCFSIKVKDTKQNKDYLLPCISTSFVRLVLVVNTLNQQTAGSCLTFSSADVVHVAPMLLLPDAKKKGLRVAILRLLVSQHACQHVRERQWFVAVPFFVFFFFFPTIMDISRHTIGRWLRRHPTYGDSQLCRPEKKRVKRAKLVFFSFLFFFFFVAKTEQQNWRERGSFMMKAQH